MTAVKTEFLDEDINKKMRSDWQTLKSKYAEVLTRKQVKFDKKLGPMLDKRAKIIKSVQGYTAPATIVIVKPLLSSLKSNAKALTAASAAYLERVDDLPNPAKNALTTFLNRVRIAAESDTDWIQVILNYYAKAGKKK